MRVGDALTLFDGSGFDYPGTIITLDKRSVVVALADATATVLESPLQLTLWHGICRGSRMDYVVQKATELGVAGIQPVMTERGVVKLNNERGAGKVAHWRKIAISAAEQSGRSQIPEIKAPRSLQQCLAEPTDTGLRLMLHPGSEQPLSSLAFGQARITLLTGPEGGFTSEERDAAGDAGFVLAGMGPRVLRSETAPVAALAIVQSVAGDLGSGGS